MLGIQTLRRLLKVQDPASARDEIRRLPANELRFALEYPAAPDIAAERAAFAALLESDGFTLRHLFGFEQAALAHILVLRFPAIERTLSREGLFLIAYDLADARKLVRAEPDLGAEIYADPLEPGTELRPEAADVLGPLCWVSTEAPANKRWALETMGVLRAWARFPARGKGIRVAQPDTGICDHAEVDRTALDFASAADILDGDADPTDPLTPGTANPGHGTGTASVVISRDAGAIIGSAPEALLVPIRCTDDVKIFDGTPIAAAIDHATRTSCDVITMSLGGLPSFAVHAAVRAAVAKGAIVLAAAGNCMRIVAYPARYREVIAVAGINIADKPWRGSCRGSTVDISAPAELVWRAERNKVTDPTTTVGGGQGTSFAVALTAGVAALWLSHHGRDEVRAEAATRGVSVQALFKAALQASARQPAGWDADDFGAGIVDAEKLLELALTAIPRATPEAVAVTGVSAQRLLDETAGVRAPDPAFDWRRYELELASMLYEDARLGRASVTATAEVAPAKAQPSSEFAAAAQQSSDERLRALGRRKLHRAPPLAPPADRSVAVPTSLIQILGRPPEAGLEAAGTLTPQEALKNLHGAGIKAKLDAVQERLDAMAAREGAADPLAARMRNEVLGMGEEALNRLVKADAPRMAEADVAALEALVRLTDRPAIRVEKGKIDVDHPEIQPWRGPFGKAQEEIENAFRRVGRIDLDGVHVGTGFVVDAGVVMTNRHVIEAFAAPVPKRRNPRSWVLLSEDVVISFADDAQDDKTAFRIKSVIAAGKEPIEDVVSFNKLDMALLEVETTNAAGRKLPSRVKLMSGLKPLRESSQIFTVGFPAEPPALITDHENKVREDVMARLKAIFRKQYGVKYFSPGLVSTAVGKVGGDPADWVFNHDATTLGGNSGSATLVFTDPVAVVGLHFAGDLLRANHAHAVAAVRSSGALPRLESFDWIS